MTRHITALQMLTTSAVRNSVERSISAEAKRRPVKYPMNASQDTVDPYRSDTISETHGSQKLRDRRRALDPA